MNQKKIDAAELRMAFLSGAKAIEAKKEYINELNVFPVPDGDTGTNMTLTIMSAADAVYAMTNPKMADLCKAMSSGSLRGARGNSGVILSQLLRGFTKVCGTVEELDAKVCADAFEKAVETAYKAVMKPKEGTILTVAKAGADKARELASADLSVEDFFKQIIDATQVSLDNTPELLPVLKEAGVVDSGGQGLLEFLRGAYAALTGNPISFAEAVVAAEEEPSASASKFTYSVEYMLTPAQEMNHEDELKLKSYIEAMSDEVSVSSKSGKICVKACTDAPGKVISKGVALGTLTDIKMENLKASAAESDTCESCTAESSEEPVSSEHKKDGFVAVSIGAGMNEIFKELGVDYIIEGGQTMNPSTDDVLKAIESINADNIYVLPNNKNIILAADQAKSLTEDKNVIVIPTKTVPQGITALINYMYDNSPEDNERDMTESLATVKTGQITYAVRDTQIDGFEIKMNDIMGLDDKTIKAVGSNIHDVAFDLTKQMVTEDSALITLYYGEETTMHEAEKLCDALKEEFPDLEVEIHEGGQPIYYYVISVE